VITFLGYWYKPLLRQKCLPEIIWVSFVIMFQIINLEKIKLNVTMDKKRKYYSKKIKTLSPLKLDFNKSSFFAIIFWLFVIISYLWGNLVMLFWHFNASVIKLLNVKFEQVEFEVASLLVLFFIILIIRLHLNIKHQRIPALYFNFSAICLSVIYFIDRISLNNWNYEKISDNLFLVYLDVPFGVLLLYVVISSIVYITIKEKNNSKNELQLKNDNVPDTLDELDDKLKRNSYARNLINLIDKTNIESSLGVGIVGSWGSGKSFFLKLLIKELKSNYADNIIIEFNPWIYDSQEVLLNDFLNSLRKEIGKIDKALQIYLNDYLKELLKQSNKLKPLSGLIPKETIKDKKEKLRNRLKILNRKVFVFIDDLDRLDQEEVLQICKLIRNTADFPNLCFTVAYDKEQLLKQANGNSVLSADYLEKIIQFEYYLPMIHDDDLYLPLFSRIDQIITSSKYTDVFDGLGIIYKTDSKLREIFFNNIKNRRDANRFLNLLLVEIENVKNRKLNLIDFLELLVLKFRFPTIYNILISNKDTLLNTESKLIYNGNLFEHLKGDLGRNLPKKDLMYIEEILFELFPESNNPEKNNSINDYENYYDYFTNLFDQFHLKQRLADSNIKKQISRYISSERRNEKIMSLEIEYSNILLSQLKNETEFQNLLNSYLFYLKIIAKHDNDKKEKLIKFTENLYQRTSEKKYVNQYFKVLKETDDLSMQEFDSFLQIIYTLLQDKPRNLIIGLPIVEFIKFFNEEFYSLIKMKLSKYGKWEKYALDKRKVKVINPWITKDIQLDVVELTNNSNDFFKLDENDRKIIASNIFFILFIEGDSERIIKKNYDALMALYNINTNSDFIRMLISGAKDKGIQHWQEIDIEENIISIISEKDMFNELEENILLNFDYYIFHIDNKSRGNNELQILRENTLKFEQKADARDIYFEGNYHLLYYHNLYKTLLLSGFFQCFTKQIGTRFNLETLVLFFNYTFTFEIKRRERHLQIINISNRTFDKFIDVLRSIDLNLQDNIVIEQKGEEFYINKEKYQPILVDSETSSE